MLVDIWRIRIERWVYRARNSNFSEWASGSIETRVCNKMLTSDKFYRSFVLLPCEICVVPFGHRKIAVDWNDIPLAKMKSTVVGLTHACASLCSFKHGYLSLQKCSLQQYFIKKLPLPTWFHNCRIYPSKNTPYSVAFSEKAPPFRFLTSQSSWQIGCRFSIDKLITSARRYASPQTRLCVAKLL